LETGHDVVVIDNFSNSAPSNIDAITEVAGRRPVCIEADIRDRRRIREALAQSGCDCVLHLAALKSVPESISHPERYEDVNVGGTAILVEEALRARIHKFIFCSSAAVYGQQSGAAHSEMDTPAPSTPYAHSKWAAEQLLREAARSQSGFRACSLRCFNPIGSHPTAQFESSSAAGDLLSNVLLARRNESVVDVFGVDYDTPDRSAVRDFVHVMDVADGCVAASTLLAATTNAAFEGAPTFNLGTGRGCSVLQLIETMEKIGGKSIRWRERARRSGDIAVSVADPTLCATVFNWRARRSLEMGCVDALRSFERSLSV
jgi:UDP-glucose 4-epimerase